MHIERRKVKTSARALTHTTTYLISPYLAGQTLKIKSDIPGSNMHWPAQQLEMQWHNLDSDVLR